MNRSWLSGRRQHRSRRDKLRRIPITPLGVESLEQRRLLAVSAAAAPQLVEDSSYQPASLIVQFRQGVIAPSSLAAYSAGSRLGTQWALTPGMREVQLNAGTDLATALIAYRSDPNVSFVEPDYRVKLNTTPNDPSFGDQWNLHNEGQTGGVPGADIHAPAAWDVTTGDPSTIVAVIDTGVDYTHPDLAANMWTNPGEIPNNEIDDDGDGFVDDVYGYDFANRDGDPMDDHFHGTHVAGIIAATADNGLGVSGVAPSVKIMALKFLDNTGSGNTSDAIAALNFAVTHGATISNNSWGDYGFSAALKTAIQNAADKGHIFVAAAGNDANNNDAAPFYPASDNVYNIVSVTATDASDRLADFSNYGRQTVDVGAPGVDIYSTLPTNQTAAMNDAGLTTSYGTLSGTSEATPHVTGVIALVRSLHPDWSVQQVIQQVLLSVDPVSSLKTITATGGRLNAAAAVGTPRIDPLPPDPSAPFIVQNDPSGVITGPIDHLRLQFSKPIDPGTFDPSDIVSFDGPDGPIPVLAVTGVLADTRQFDVSFDPQVGFGTYTLVVGPHIRDFAGTELDQNGNSLIGETPDDQYTASFAISGGPIFQAANLPAPIFSLAPVVQFESFLTIDQDVPITDYRVHVNITYPQDGDLMLVLVGPTGNVVFLSSFNGGAGSNYDDTVFDDWPGTLIFQGSAPFAGTYMPESALSGLSAPSALGTWTLVIQNWGFGSFSGTLNSWSLELNPPRPLLHHDQPPVLTDDEFFADEGTSLTLLPDDLLSNDSDPDSDSLEIVGVQNPVGGSVTLNDDGTVTFVPDNSGLLTGSFQYLVSDGFNMVIGNVTIHIHPLFQYHNSSTSADVNHDGLVAPNDALLLINQLNSFGSAPLKPTRVTVNSTLYFDVVPDNFVAPSDALAVINYLNAGLGHATSASPPEGEGAASTAVLSKPDTPTATPPTSQSESVLEAAALASDPTATPLKPPTGLAAMLATSQFAPQPLNPSASAAVRPGTTPRSTAPTDDGRSLQVVAAKSDSPFDPLSGEEIAALLANLQRETKPPALPRRPAEEGTK